MRDNDKDILFKTAHKQRFQNAINILNLKQDKSYHNALNDAYYTAQVFMRIYSPNIVPDIYIQDIARPPIGDINEPMLKVALDYIEAEE